MTPNLSSPAAAPAMASAAPSIANPRPSGPGAAASGRPPSPPRAGSALKVPRPPLLPWYLRPHAAGIEAAQAKVDRGESAATSARDASRPVGSVERRYALFSSLHPTGRRVLTGELVLDSIADDRSLLVGLRQVLPLSAGEEEHTEGELELAKARLRSPRRAALRCRLWNIPRKQAQAEWQHSLSAARGASTSAWSLLSAPLPALVASDRPQAVDLWEELELLHPGCVLQRTETPTGALPGGVPAAAWVLAGPTVPPRVLVLDGDGEPLAFSTISRCYLRVAA